VFGRGSRRHTADVTAYTRLEPSGSAASVAWLIGNLVGILPAVFIGALDPTIVDTRLPELVEDLQDVSRYAWVPTANLLASTVAEAVAAAS
jgi:hypothetical protein